MHTEKSFRNLANPNSKWNLDCNYPFPIDLAPNTIPFVAKSIGKVIPKIFLRVSAAKNVTVSSSQIGGKKKQWKNVYIHIKTISIISHTEMIDRVLIGICIYIHIKTISIISHTEMIDIVLVCIFIYV